MQKPDFASDANGIRAIRRLIMRRLSTLFLILALVLSVGNLFARETRLAGELHLRGNHAEIDGCSFVPAGPLARALGTCHGQKLEVTGVAVSLDERGAAPLFFVNAIALYGQVKGSAKDYKTLFGSLAGAKNQALVVDGTVFAPRGPLADAALECTGLDVTVDTVVESENLLFGSPEFGLRVLSLRANRPASVQAAKVEAWARYAEGYPPVNAEGPDGTYPRVRTLHVDGDLIVVIMETAGGIAGIGTDVVRYEFDGEGQFLRECEF